MHLLLLRTLLLLCFCLSACGYAFQGSGSVLPDDVRKVFVPLAVNNTTEPGLAQLVTEAMQERFERFGVVQIVDSLQEADAQLKTKIIALNRNKRSVTSGTDTALQIDSTLILSAELRRITGPLLWADPRLEVTKSFGSTSDVVVTSSADFASAGLNEDDLNALNNRELARGQEQQTLEDLAQQAAREVYNQAVAPDF